MLATRCKLNNRQAILQFSVQKPKIFDGVDGANFGDSLTNFRGLADTGAQRTCLSQHVVSSAGLIRHGHKSLRTMRDEQPHSLYFANLGFWGNTQISGNEVSDSNSYFALTDPIEVFGMNDNENFDALIGMDILSMFNFSFNKLRQEFELMLSS